MDITAFIGKPLRDREIIDLLEQEEVDVIYDFDRLNENTADQYWASFRKLGVQFGFDADQLLSVVFLYVKEHDGFVPCDLSVFGLRGYESCSEVESFALDQGLEVKSGQSDLFGVEIEWIRFVKTEHRIHYEFRNGVLYQITISAK